MGDTCQSQWVIDNYKRKGQEIAGKALEIFRRRISMKLSELIKNIMYL